MNHRRRVVAQRNAGTRAADPRRRISLRIHPSQILLEPAHVLACKLDAVLRSGHHSRQRPRVFLEHRNALLAVSELALQRVRPLVIGTLVSSTGRLESMFFGLSKFGPTMSAVCLRASRRDPSSRRPCEQSAVLFAPSANGRGSSQKELCARSALHSTHLRGIE
jgi:hypothetical protein